MKSIIYTCFAALFLATCAYADNMPVSVDPATGQRTSVDDNASGWVWSGMTIHGDPNCYGGSAHAGGPGSFGTYTFYGTGVTVYVTRGPIIIQGDIAHKTGELRVSIDGEVKGEVSLSNSSTESRFAAFTEQGMPAKNHVITLGAVAGWVDIDYLDVFTDPDTPAASSPSDEHATSTSRPDGALSTITLVPASYQTIRGKDNGQPVTTSIDVLDEFGKTNDWVHYLQFQSRTAGSAYFGTRNYYLPQNIAADSVTSLSVTVHCLGPIADLQLWTWYIYDFSTGTGVEIGANRGTIGWNGWSDLNFVVPGDASRFIHPGDGLIQLATSSNNAADDMDVDYEAIVVSYNAPVKHSAAK